MKLTQKIIEKLKYTVVAEMSITCSKLQAEVKESLSIEEKEFDYLVDLYKKYKGEVNLGLIKTTFKKGAVLLVTNIGGLYTRVTMADDGEVYYPSNLGFGKVLNRYYPQHKEKDWATILSAYGTVEEAIEAYPELRLSFETLFEKKL